MQINWRFVLRLGLLAGGITLYTGVIGMLVAFSEREVIREYFTLGQLMLVFPTLGISFYVARRANRDSVSTLVSGLVLGIVASLPMLAFLLLNNIIDLRQVLVNITRDLLEMLTFNQESQLTGSLYLMGTLTVAGVVGAGITLIPNRLRHALLMGLAWMLGVGILGELVRQLLGQLDNRALQDFVLRRDTLKPQAAIVIFVLAFISDLFWSFQGPVVRQYIQTQPPPQKRNLRLGSIGVFALLLLILPLFVGTAISDILTSVGLFILMGLGLNIAIGLSGLLDLGYVTNFAVGAYVMAVLTSTGPLGAQDRLGIDIFSFWLVLPISLLSAMFTGFIFALPVLRMRGDYLAIATLGFGEIIRLLALSDWLRPLIGGAQGVLFVPKPVIFSFELTGPRELYYVILASCLLALYVSQRLNNSRTGRQWMAIREDEDVAAAMGINTAKAKLLAFTLSAATGGVAGAIFAAKLGTIFPSSFNLLVSVNVLSLIIVGGMGSIPGIVVGAFFLIGLPELLREFDEFRLLLYGALLIVMMLSRPEGIWPSAVHRREMHQDEDGSEQKSKPEASSPEQASAVVAGD